jgi:hypothetical protein
LPLMRTFVPVNCPIIPLNRILGESSSKFSLSSVCANAAAGRAHSVTTPRISGFFVMTSLHERALTRQRGCT